MDSLLTNASTAASIWSLVASCTSSVAKPSCEHSAATSCASLAAFFSGLLVYLLLPMHSATWVAPRRAGVVYMPRADAMESGAAALLSAAHHAWPTVAYDGRGRGTMVSIATVATVISAHPR